MTRTLGAPHRLGGGVARFVAPWLLAGAVIGMALAPTGCASPSAEEKQLALERHLAQGLAFHDRGELDKALKEYNAALKLDPDNAKVYVNRSNIYLESRDTYEKAIADATRAIELDPTLAEAYVNRAAALVDMGHLAHSHFHGKPPPGSARAAPREERFEKAIADATRAIELNPTLASAYFTRAHAYGDTGRPELAIADYTTTLGLDPNPYLEVITYTHRAQAYRYLGQLEQALQDATQAMEMGPKLVVALAQDPSLRTGQGADAIIATAHTIRGQVYQQQGQLDLAIAEYTTALQRDPEQIEGYVNRSTAYISRGLYREAVADASRALELNHSLAQAYSNRALAYFGLGDAKAAIADTAKALELNPNLASAYSTRAYIYTGMGRYDDAVDSATRAIELDPNLASAYSNRAEAHLLKGDYDAVIADSDRALELDPTLVGTLVGRALAHLSKRQYSQAFDDADQALTLDPGQLEARYVRGRARLALSDGQEGWEDLAVVVESSRNPRLVELARGLLARRGQ